MNLMTTTATLEDALASVSCVELTTVVLDARSARTSYDAAVARAESAASRERWLSSAVMAADDAQSNLAGLCSGVSPFPGDGGVSPDAVHEASSRAAAATAALAALGGRPALNAARSDYDQASVDVELLHDVWVERCDSVVSVVDELRSFTTDPLLVSALGVVAEAHSAEPPEG